jgi:hypothetical protein
MTCKLFLCLLICCLSHLFMCQRLDAERRLKVPKHEHHRRATKFGDDRFLNFEFTHEPSDTVVIPGGSSLFNCLFDFSDKQRSDVRIEWRKDGVTVSPTRPVGRVLIISNGSLLIENVLSSDRGEYQCAVHISPRKEPRFTWSFLSKRALLRVPDTEIFEINPLPRQVRLNQPNAFQCLLNSFFPGQVEWYKDDRRIYEGGKLFFLFFPF